MSHERSRLVDLLTRNQDELAVGVGTSPLPGDLGSPLVNIPSDPTRDWRDRYRFVLASYSVPKGYELRLMGIGQALRVGWIQEIEVPAEPEPITVLQRIDIPVTDPDFSFVDGNVSWHLRFVQGEVQEGELLEPTTPPPGPGILISQYPSSSGLQALDLGPYLPPQGDIPGEAVGSLGTFNDLRFLGIHKTPTMRVNIRGPGRLLFMATVFQTDPANRVPLQVPQGFPPEILTPEQRMVLAAPTLARFTRIGGRLLVDLNQRPIRSNPDQPPVVVDEL